MASRPGWDLNLRKVTRVRLAKEASQGEYCEGVLWKPVPSGHVAETGLAAAAEFQPGRVPIPETQRQVPWRPPDDAYPRPGPAVDLGDQLLVSRFTRARAEQRGGDAYGEVAYGGYITPDTSLTRYLS